MKHHTVNCKPRLDDTHMTCINPFRRDWIDHPFFKDTPDALNILYWEMANYKHLSLVPCCQKWLKRTVGSIIAKRRSKCRSESSKPSQDWNIFVNSIMRFIYFMISNAVMPSPKTRSFSLLVFYVLFYNKCDRCLVNAGTFELSSRVILYQ